MKCTSSSANSSWTVLRYPASARQGGQPAYQKLMTTTSPRMAFADSSSPSMDFAVKSIGSVRLSTATSVTAPVPEM